MELISNEKLDIIIDQIQKLETPKQFRGQCIRSNDILALKELKELREIDNKWISVKDRLPEINKEKGYSKKVLICISNKYFTNKLYVDSLVYKLVYLDEYVFESVLGNTTVDISSVGYWMPLHTPPNEGE